MATSTGPVLSGGQKLDLIVALCQAVGNMVLALLCAPFRGQNTPGSLKRHVLMSTMRKAFSRFSFEQTQYLFGGSTEANYLAWTKQESIQPQPVTLPDGTTKAFWIGNSHAKTVILYIHGGGFVMPGSPGQLGFTSSIVSAAKHSGKAVAVLFLQYDLMPQARYPHQLRQAVNLLRYAINGLGKRPSQLMLAGDSAGGNVILGILGHLSHPHPQIDPLPVSEPLKGVVMSSPWTNLRCTGDSYVKNKRQDPVLPSTIVTWATNYLAGAAEDNYNYPAKAPTTWWQGLKAQDVLIVGGADEMMREDIEKLGKTFQTIHPRTTVFIAPGGFHAQPTISRDVGLEEGQQANVIRGWIVERI